jgi:hypothetical protein
MKIIKEVVVSVIIEKLSDITLDYIIQQMQTTNEIAQKARQFFKTEKLGKASLKVALGAVVDALMHMHSSIADNEYFQLVRKECYVSGTAGCMTFATNNIIDIAKSLAPRFAQFDLKDLAKEIKEKGEALIDVKEYAIT